MLELKNICFKRDGKQILNNINWELPSGKFVVITGPNGSGKSTIWSAICYALTGETLSGIKNNLKRLGADNEEMYVELTLEVDGDTYTIKRGEN